MPTALPASPVLETKFLCVSAPLPLGASITVEISQGVVVISPNGVGLDQQDQAIGDYETEGGVTLQEASAGLFNRLLITTTPG